ncbi:MAG TPA: hypothetical protein VGC09_19110 [Rhodopila sp.]
MNAVTDFPAARRSLAAQGAHEIAPRITPRLAPGITPRITPLGTPPGAEASRNATERLTMAWHIDSTTGRPVARWILVPARSDDDGFQR